MASRYRVGPTPLRFLPLTPYGATRFSGLDILRRLSLLSLYAVCRDALLCISAPSIGDRQNLWARSRRFRDCSHRLSSGCAKYALREIRTMLRYHERRGALFRIAQPVAPCFRSKDSSNNCISFENAHPFSSAIDCFPVALSSAVAIESRFPSSIVSA